MAKHEKVLKTVDLQETNENLFIFYCNGTPSVNDYEDGAEEQIRECKKLYSGRFILLQLRIIFFRKTHVTGYNIRKKAALCGKHTVGNIRLFVMI